jgi:hypothetical protein
VDRYSDPYGYRVADACRYAADNPIGNAFPYVPCTYPNVLADVHANGHANTPSDANTGSHAYTHLASDSV